MQIKDITPQDREKYNKVVHHPLQSYEWGEFREKSGIKVIRKGIYIQDKLTRGFQLTLHKVPRTANTIGYLPKGDKPTSEMLEALIQIGKENNCIFIQLEPNLLKDEKSELQTSIFPIVQATHPLFTKYTFILDLTQSEETLLANMHHKTRYNIRVAQKHNVTVSEDDSAEAFEIYWKIMEETTSRQKFYAHTKRYHLLQKNTFSSISTTKSKLNDNQLSYHLFIARYNGKPLTAWVLFVFHDTLYYPYGSSTSENREVMASNLMMWEAIRFGKKLGLKKFDMWGALSEEPDIKDPWYGFHRFKQGYGSKLTEFVGSYDLIIQPIIYQGFKIADKLRWIYLRLRK